MVGNNFVNNTVSSQEVVLRRRINKLYKKMITAQARVYDLEHQSLPEPTSQELKAKIVYLTGEVAKISAERDMYKRKAAQKGVFNGG
jgi:competence protein ComGC